MQLTMSTTQANVQYSLPTLVLFWGIIRTTLLPQPRPRLVRGRCCRELLLSANGT